MNHTFILLSTLIVLINMNMFAQSSDSDLAIRSGYTFSKLHSADESLVNLNGRYSINIGIIYSYKSNKAPNWLFL